MMINISVGQIFTVKPTKDSLYEIIWGERAEEKAYVHIFLTLSMKIKF